jgi:hypothetical protein
MQNSEGSQGEHPEDHPPAQGGDAGGRVRGLRQLGERLRLTGLGFLTLLVLVAFAVWKDSGRDSWAAALLLMLSIGLDYFVLRPRLADCRLANDLAWCEILKIFFLFCYVFGGRISLRFGITNLTPILGRIGGALALVIAGVVTWLMLRVASEMLSSEGSASPLIQELLHDKMLAVAGVLLAFLHVTYLMTFALAISDRANKSDLFGREYVRLELGCSDDAPTGASLCRTEEPYRVRQLFFAESVATLSCTEELRKAVEQQNRNHDICESRPDLDSRIRAIDDVDVPACHSVGFKLEPDGGATLSLKDPKVENETDLRYARRSAAVCNILQLHELWYVFHHLACAGQGKSYVVEIRGHANETKFKTDSARAYGSNFEISKQRADQVELILTKIWREANAGLEAPAVRWLAYGESNESSFLELDESKWPKQQPDTKRAKSDIRPEKDRYGLEKGLSVEIRILPIDDSFQDGRLRAASSGKRVLNLTDYLYFTVYTITTTGYGDIIPISPYAEFVVSIANFMELFFIVLLVNVVANAREPK